MKKTLATAIVLSLTSCAMPPNEHVSVAKPDKAPETRQIKPRTSNYVNITTPKKQLLDERVTINHPRLAVIDALTHPESLTKANIIAKDPGVNLAMKIGVKAQNAKIGDYIAQIEGTTDYNIEIDGINEDVTLNISSVMTKSWDLATLSDMPQVTTRAGFSATERQDSNSEERQTSGASGAEITTERQDETWDKLITDAKNILGLNGENEDSSNSNNENNNTLMPELGEGDDPIAMLNEFGNRLDDEMNPYHIEPWVVGNKRIGKITAFGKPSQIARLDEYFTKLMDESRRQVHIQGAILDIKTNSGEGYGIDWNAVYQNGAGDKTLSIGGEASQALSIVDGGSWSVAASIPFGNLTLDALMSSLREQGSVSVQSQPRLTVTNGYTAYLGSTQEFTYVSGVEFLPLATSGGDSVSTETAVTTTLSRVNVGIKIAVTPKMLDNGKILVDIVPILSSISGFTPIQSGGEVFETPNIALQEMATQVITTSGTPIYLGGLVMNRVLQNAKKLPLKNEFLAKVLGSASFEQENSELLIVITPQEVGA